MNVPFWELAGLIVVYIAVKWIARIGMIMFIASVAQQAAAHAKKNILGGLQNGKGQAGGNAAKGNRDQSNDVGKNERA